MGIMSWLLLAVLLQCTQAGVIVSPLFPSSSPAPSPPQAADVIVSSPSSPTSSPPPPPQYDVVVYGSSPAGIAAAIAASSLGMRVLLLEPLNMIGGMGSAGNLALNDGGMNAERTGLALHFSLINGVHYYGKKSNRQVPHPESFVSNATFYTMLKNANFDVHNDLFLGCRIVTVNNDAKKTKINSIVVTCFSQPITATVFIDASYDGDIMTRSHVDYTFGR